MFAVHVPDAALRRIESFAGLEFDVCLRDASLPFVCDEPVAVVARRVSVVTDRGLGGTSKLQWAGGRDRGGNPAPGPMGKLNRLVSFCAPPLRLPLALARYDSQRQLNDGTNAFLETQALCFIDLAAFPPQHFPAEEVKKDGGPPSFTNPLLQRAMKGVFAGAWTPWPAASSPTIVAAHTDDIRGLRLYWIGLPESGSRAPARLLRVLCVDLNDIPFMTDPVPLMADPEGRFVFVATQSLRTINCLKICADSGNVLASSGTEGAAPGKIVPLAPDLWLHLAWEDTALMSATEMPRPQPAFWQALCKGRQESTDLLPLRMSRGRLLLHHRRTGELLLCQLRGGPNPDMHFCGALEQTLGGDPQQHWRLVSEGPEVEHLILRSPHDRSVIVHGDLRRPHGLVVRNRASLVVRPCQAHAHPALAAVFDQARRQKERRVAAAAVAQGGPRRGWLASAEGAKPAASPEGSAANPIDLT